MNGFEVMTSRGCRWFLFLLFLAGLAAASPAEEPPLWKAADICALTRTRAAERLPVKVRGVVTCERALSMVVQDDTGGIYVAFSPKDRNGFGDGNSLFGQQVEVVGVTGPGGFAPVVLSDGIRLLGAGKLPAPQPGQYSELQTGTFTNLRVELCGVVQNCRPVQEKGIQMRLELAMPGGNLLVYVKQWAGLDAAQLVDAEVRVIGVVFPSFTPRGEFLAANLQVNHATDIELLKPAAPDPFAVPEVSPLALRPYRPQGPYLHRQRLTGTVTLCRPGEYFYVQMKERSVRVNTRSAERLEPGERVEASGFVEQSGDVAVLNDTVFHRLGRGPLPEARPVTLAQVLSIRPLIAETARWEDYDGVLVKLRGRLLNAQRNDDKDPRLNLDCGGGVVMATLPSSASADALEQLRPDSELEVTGICSVQFSGISIYQPSPKPVALQLILPDLQAVRVLRAPSWWTAVRLWAVLGGMGVMMALVLAWVWLLRRTVARQTVRLVTEEQAKRDAEVEFRATLRERNRLAADLHDTMEQNLTAVALQLETARVMQEEQPAEVMRRTEFARELLERTRDDLRRSVWSMRVGILEGRGFADALRELASRTERTYGMTCSCQLESDGSSVPEFEANHLLLIAQEAITNVLKHAQAKSIVVTAKITAHTVALTVTDDGVGFDPAQAPGPQAGHFGLLGMTERLRGLAGTLNIQSASGQGTRVEVTVPLSPRTE